MQFRLESNNALGLVSETVAGIGSSSATAPAGAWALLVASYNQTSGVYSFRLNGKALTGGTNKQALSSNTTVIGQNAAANGEWANGQMGELVALTTPTLSEIVNYEALIAWRFGLASILDPSHPRKNRPPLIGD